MIETEADRKRREIRERIASSTRTKKGPARVRTVAQSRGLASIPTVYRNVQYRSRLEARWAAMFDRLGWQYAYEPFDLHGWIPDFMLLGLDPLLVEVKPISNFAFEKNAAVIAKIEKSSAGTEYETTDKLLLGLMPQAPSGEYPPWGPALGLFGEFMPSNEEFNWDQVAVLLHAQGKFDVCAEIGGHAGRLALGYLGGHPPVADFELVQQLWAQAGNEVQWRSPVRH